MTSQSQTLQSLDTDVAVGVWSYHKLMVRSYVSNADGFVTSSTYLYLLLSVPTLSED
jgi:hypothetical protein